MIGTRSADLPLDAGSSARTGHLVAGPRTDLEEITA